MGSIVSVQKLIRISEEEAELWEQVAEQANLPLSVLIRKVMNSAAGRPELSDQVERRILQSQRDRASASRQKRWADKDDVAMPPSPQALRKRELRAQAAARKAG